jgi:5-(carboxyamino)imidazole ribonucleotide mutase
MVAAKTTLPVIGVPVRSAALQGLDSLLSIVQMPRGVPVATVAIGGAANAALLAVRILATRDLALRAALEAYQAEQARAALAEP